MVYWLIVFCLLPFSTVFQFYPVHLSIFSWSSFNLFPHNDTFWRPWETSFLKTLWEKEKMLVTSNFSFSHSVFYRWNNFLPFSSNFKLSSAKSFNLEESKICRLVMGLPVLCTIFFPSHWLLSYINIVETMDSSYKRGNSVQMSIINPRKE